MPRRKKDRGRPPVKPMPERIDATPEDIAESLDDVQALLNRLVPFQSDLVG